MAVIIVIVIMSTWLGRSESYEYTGRRLRNDFLTYQFNINANDVGKSK